MRKLWPSLVATIAVAPLTIYAAFLAWDCSVKAWKVGWDGAPLTFVGVTGIFAFVVYGMVIAILGCMYAYRHSDRGVWGVSVFAVAVLALYGIAFAGSFIGVLPAR